MSFFLLEGMLVAGDHTEEEKKKESVIGLWQDLIAAPLCLVAGESAEMG